MEAPRALAPRREVQVVQLPPPPEPEDDWGWLLLLPMEPETAGVCWAREEEEGVVRGSSKELRSAVGKVVGLVS
jgi:hypothetical protein